MVDRELGNTAANTFDVEELLEVPEYSDDDNAPDDTLYWNSDEPGMRYKDAAGVVHEP